MSSVEKRKPKIAPIIKKEVKEEENVLESYSEQEFIPSHAIPSLIQTTFPSSTIIHTYSHHHRIIKVNIHELLQAPIINWQFNRPADRTRCEDIARYIAISKKPVDTMIYVAYNNKKRTFEIIDGIHRYTALTIIQEKSQHLDFISANEFSGDMTWLMDSFIILNVRLNAIEGELIELFKSLNKSNPVPDLYVRDTAKDKRDAIQTLAIKWQNRFKVHFSASNKPNKPNINRDRFIDILEAVYDKYHLTEETKDKLEHILERNNGHISLNVPKKLTQHIREKCEATGCWLFLYSAEELMKML